MEKKFTPTLARLAGLNCFLVCPDNVAMVNREEKGQLRLGNFSQQISLKKRPQGSTMFKHPVGHIALPCSACRSETTETRCFSGGSQSLHNIVETRPVSPQTHWLGRMNDPQVGDTETCTSKKPLAIQDAVPSKSKTLSAQILILLLLWWPDAGAAEDRLVIDVGWWTLSQCQPKYSSCYCSGGPIQGRLKTD
ncbi:hypothetical protein RRG08_029180 [Elysia crispata]|uniref:Uncharacterized protein n=1 Tax=Elysia crispata TaxID=231223 RepID=A0AAE1E0U7_9GAST|nr:hypothetical protein RRG08_029180 [Elysia crispata]